ncbi:MAG: tRNA (adenosine(37)-N6)-threonylcarbamoyltransferase complex dimerization subunit type 1 TsaB, partial [Proteobacteria bacterium]|nr:tRNA (adenosine(37)-N6)-threonylcarbamoyltransferase complex dimerization subunit type 1 TsaB [Pseudomonadota bacterium]
MTKMTEIKEGVCLLAVEASGNSASMAVVTGDAVLGVAKREATHAHAPHMADLLKQCLAEAKVEAVAITHVAAGCGPGSFTGIRTGLALAKGVALALAVPIYGVSSLTALLSEVSEVPSESTSMSRSILVVVDSRRGGYFACLYDGENKAVTPVFETNAETLAGRVKEISPKIVTLLGHDAANLARALQSEG